jgi:dihydroneopterin triphosphate diphosphatase
MSPDAACKRPESVLVVVATRGHEVLLLERRHPSGFQQSVTGSLEWGESPLAAARRELLEETGIAGDTLEDLRIGARFPIRPEWRKRFAPGVRENREHWFLLCLESPVPVRLSAEHAAAQWLPAREAARRVDSWSNRLAIERYASGC